MPQSKWLNDEQFIQNWMLRGVQQPLLDLFNQVRALDGGFPLLRFLHANANTLMTLEDIAFFLKKKNVELEPSLNAMVEIGLANCAHIVGLTFFGLTRNPTRRQLVAELCDWQDRWTTRLEQIGETFKGKTLSLPSPDSF